MNISSSVSPSPSALNFLASGSFPMNWLFTSVGQNTGASASASVLPMNIRGWFPLGLTDLILQFKGLSSLLEHYNSKASILWHPAFFTVQLSHLFMTTGKTTALTIWTFVTKVMSLLFNMLSRFVIVFLPRNKCLWIFLATVTIHKDFEAQENKICQYFHFSPFCLS